MARVWFWQVQWNRTAERARQGHVKSLLPMVASVLGLFGFAMYL